MPLYNFSTQDNFPEDLRQGVADIITDVHCELTGAPRTFVNVIFNEGIPIEKHLDFHLLGNIRQGRTGEQRLQLADTLAERLGKLLNAPPQSRQVELFDVPASWVMEGGAILPEPGSPEEAAWNAGNIPAMVSA